MLRRCIRPMRRLRLRTCDCVAPGAIRGHRDGDETGRRGLRVFARVSRRRRRRQLVTDSYRSGEALKSQEIYTAKNNREASMKSLNTLIILAVALGAAPALAQTPAPAAPAAARGRGPQTNWWSQPGGEGGPERTVWAGRRRPEPRY